MPVRESVGMMLSGCGSVVGVLIMLVQASVQGVGLPYCPCVGTANLLIFVGVAAAVRRWRLHAQVPVRQWKWVWMRGTFGCCTYFLVFFALAMGTPMGDVSALSSVNVVVAALLGRAFLGERLHCLHYMAVVCSVAGAALIAKPAFLFGQPPSQRQAPVLGHMFALSAGITYGGVFISARRSQTASPLVTMLAVAVIETVAFWLVGVSGFVHEPPLSFAAAAPLKAAAATGLLAVLLCCGTCACTAGAQMCPAAVSSAIYTSVSMFFAYTAQMALHPRPLEALTAAGAAMMLMAVLLMTAGTCLLSKPPAAPGCAAGLPGADGAGGAPEAQQVADVNKDKEEDECESLASFIASEFSGLSSHERLTRQRQRRPSRGAAALSPALQTTIGVASA